MSIDVKVRFIDLFAGMGGFRIGFETACVNLGVEAECVFSSELKEHAVQVYKDNFKESSVFGDITKIPSKDIPDFDVMLAGFPCQAFSSAGKRHGFSDTRGTLFFEIERILQEKAPSVFILENVDGLINHDKDIKSDDMGRTLKIILEKLEQLNYKVNWQLLDAKNFGLAQNRKRVFIVGTKINTISLSDFPLVHTKLKNILESEQPVMDTKLSKLLLSHFSLKDLHGKSVKDKRGGKNNIHSWDIGLKGEVSVDQKILLGLLLKSRRNKKWGEIKGIKWMDGMPLTIDEIRTFYQHPHLQKLLDDLTSKKYLRFEHPKDEIEIIKNDTTKKVRQYREDLPKGYNIVAGKLSYEINKILDPEDTAPTLVATDLDRFVVPDKTGIRKLTLREQCRLFGFPDNFSLNIEEQLAHDLLGNTVPVPVVTAVSKRIIERVFLNKTENVKHLPSPKKAPSQLSLLELT